MLVRRYWLGCVMVALLVGSFGCSSGSSSSEEDQASQSDVQADTQQDTAVPACTVGEACDDGDPCTQDDKCAEDGVCRGTDQAESCPSLECATSECDGKGGCTELVIESGYCVINGACVAEGAVNEANACQACVTTSSTSLWSPLGEAASCEDGDPCTENDHCSADGCVGGTDGTCDDGLECTTDACGATGCTHEADNSACNDENDCTVDSCDPLAGCTFTPDDTALCGDGDVCTLNNHCSSGECVYDGVVECEDNNTCTDEFCHPSYGCIYAFNTGTCDDGHSCTEEDTCHFGRCEGVENYYNPCPTCNVEFGPNVQKVISLRFGAGGMPGEALNVDNDIKTCSPPSSCQDGLDNTLTFAADIVNPTLEANLTDAESPMIILAALMNATFDGQPFTTALLYGGRSESNPDCDVQHDVCDYRTGSISFDPLCSPNTALTNAYIENNILTAGGSGYVFPYKLYFINDVMVELVLYNAKVQATLTVLPDNTITHMTGVLGGAVTPEDLATLVNAIPDEAFPGGDKQAILGLIDFMPRDIDVNGDGTKDAFSLGLVFETNLGVLEPYITYPY